MNEDENKSKVVFVDLEEYKQMGKVRKDPDPVPRNTQNRFCINSKSTVLRRYTTVPISTEILKPKVTNCAVNSGLTLVSISTSILPRPIK